MPLAAREEHRPAGRLERSTAILGLAPEAGRRLDQPAASPRSPALPEEPQRQSLAPAWAEGQSFAEPAREAGEGCPGFVRSGSGFASLRLERESPKDRTCSAWAGPQRPRAAVRHGLPGLAQQRLEQEDEPGGRLEQPAQPSPLGARWKPAAAQPGGPPKPGAQQRPGSAEPPAWAVPRLPAPICAAPRAQLHLSSAESPSAHRRAWKPATNRSSASARSRPSLPRRRSCRRGENGHARALLHPARASWNGSSSRSRRLPSKRRELPCS